MSTTGAILSSAAIAVFVLAFALSRGPARVKVVLAAGLLGSLVGLSGPLGGVMGDLPAVEAVTTQMGQFPGQVRQASEVAGSYREQNAAGIAQFRDMFGSQVTDPIVGLMDWIGSVTGPVASAVDKAGEALS